MDYEKKYKEALKRARANYKADKEMGFLENCDMLELIFPELAESEDERIRKELKEAFEAYDIESKWNGIPIRSIFAWLEKQKEQNGEDEECTDFTIYHPLKNRKGEYESIPYSFYGSLTSFSEDKDLIDFLRTCFYTEEECNEWIKQQNEQKPAPISCGHENDKPAEWSEEDESFLDSIEEAIHSYYDLNHAPQYDYWLEEKLKSLRPQPKQEWSKEDEKKLERVDDLLWMLDDYLGDDCSICEERTARLRDEIQKELCPWLKALRPDSYKNCNSRWKPSEEQMKALNALNCHGDLSYVGQQNQLISLYNDLNKLM